HPRRRQHHPEAPRLRLLAQLQSRLLAWAAARLDLHRRADARSAQAVDLRGPHGRERARPLALPWHPVQRVLCSRALRERHHARQLAPNRLLARAAPRRLRGGTEEALGGSTAAQLVVLLLDANGGAAP